MWQIYFLNYKFRKINRCCKSHLRILHRISPPPTIYEITTSICYFAFHKSLSQKNGTLAILYQILVDKTICKEETTHVYRLRACTYTYAHTYTHTCPSFGISPESGGYARMKYVSDPVWNWKKKVFCLSRKSTINHGISFIHFRVARVATGLTDTTETNVSFV